MNGTGRGFIKWFYIVIAITIIPGLAWPGSFFDTYQMNSPFKTVLDDTARAWAYAQDMQQGGVVLSSDEYHGCIYTLVGMITCVHAALNTMPLHSIADDEKAYYIRVLHCFQTDCYAVRLTSCQRAIIEELFTAIHAKLVQTNNTKLSARQYQSSYAYWQYPKKAIDRLQYRVC